MSNNNDAVDNNNDQGGENVQNQNNPPPVEWGAFPDLLRVQEPQQNGGAAVPPEAVPNSLVQRAGIANPPDVSLPGAAGRDPPPPDFDLDVSNPAMVHNQRLPDMALDANQAQGQHRSLPDMALEASGMQREQRPVGACGGVHFGRRRNLPQDHAGPPETLAHIAQAVAGGSGNVDNGVDDQALHVGPEQPNSRIQALEAQMHALRVQVYEMERVRSNETERILNEISSLRRSLEVDARAPRENRDVENRLINIESLIQRMIGGGPVQGRPDEEAYRFRDRMWQRREHERTARIFAESLHGAITHFMQQLDANHEEFD